MIECIYCKNNKILNFGNGNNFCLACKNYFERYFVLEFYEKMGWSLVKIVKEGKEAFEKNWQNIEYRDKDEWEKWIKEGYNIGVNVGLSNLTVIDFDSEETYQELKTHFNPTLLQKSNKGYHLFYKKVDILPTTNLRPSYNVDIKSNGQVVIEPSSINGFKRKFLELVEPAEMSEETISFLLNLIRSSSTSVRDKVKKEIGKIEKDGIKILPEGNRHYGLISAGGYFSNLGFTPKQIFYILNYLNNHYTVSPKPVKEIEHICESLYGYKISEEEEAKKEILDYLYKAKEASKAEIEIAVYGKRVTGEKKKKIDKVLVDLISERFLYKERNHYKVASEVEWSDDLSINLEEKVNFKVPYFYDVTNFVKSEIVLINAKTGTGKCLANGYILTQEGLKKIEELGAKKREGVSFLSHHYRIYTGGREKVYRHPNYFYKEKVSETIKIQTYSGFELEGTPEHPILVVEEIREPLKKPRKRGKNTIRYKYKIVKKFKQLKDLKEGDLVVICAPNRFPKKRERREKFHYKKSRFTTNLKKVNLPKEIDYDFARLIGYIVGDGNLQRNNICIYQDKKYKGIVNDIISIVKKLGIKAKIKEEGNQYRIFIRSSVLYQYVKQIVFNIKRKDIENLRSPFRFVPKCILEGNYEIQKGFIEAIFDCESYLKNKSLEISFSSYELAKVLQLMLLNFGILARFTKKKDKKYNKYYYRLYLRQCMTNKFFKIFNTNKYVIDWNLDDKWRSWKVRKIWGGDRFFADRIIKKEKNNEEKYVYDFNIGRPYYHTNHQFWCNGFINHNTHLALNIVKRLVEQGVKPFLIETEPTKRFIKIARILGLSSNSFYYNKKVINPIEIEFTDDSVNIIDWLDPATALDFTQTSRIFSHLAEQTRRHKAFMIVFMQLRENTKQFAKDLVNQYPSLAVNYLLEEDRIHGKFVILKNNDPKTPFVWEIPTVFIPETKEVLRLDELEERERVKNEKM